ncbi:MAG TPA: hybrid sensor histidine kinase/response regulator [Herpetosiphon sp.]|uniref:histidine kinase n=1 Tax=Herpetosiphon aurantiacus (strain ATCC 23779 / DSM 785 / 114-95) TaxID=316274 RepID=A9AW03_HERA2|nr:hybrid sensor histidine kinase/response regulator [Herpetosiphon sp.]ABX03241.1 response regulator receiver sensor signal transduction histidine kinase [Herpetosiphon aurantiacus DSM 785]HBW52536.1 hybrid sensor histidine kinase/response regulator [Herpetosiphon sp.]
MAGSTRVLYIEDNHDNQRLVRRVLATRGYQIIIANDGNEGWKSAQTDRPDLILMDINLPGLNGYELTTKFKATPQLASVPIVALTANTTPGDRERALAAGCDGYISKPIDPRALPDLVASYIGGTREVLETAEAPSVMREYSQQLVGRLESHVRELETANNRLTRLDQAKNDFLATISHELRTPLTVIHGYIDLLNMQALGPVSDGQREALELMKRNSTRLLRHINDLIYLQQVRSNQMDFAQADLRGLVQSICNDMQPTFLEKNQTLVRNIYVSGIQTPLMIHMDVHGVDNAVRHLLENATQYTAQGGVIQVSVYQDDQLVRVSIRDNGVGIPEDDFERIFEPFVRLDDTLASIGGAGLGLVIAKHVAEAHNGTVSLESTVGVGSIFTLQLPVNHQ